MIGSSCLNHDVTDTAKMSCASDAFAFAPELRASWGASAKMIALSSATGNAASSIKA